MTNKYENLDTVEKIARDISYSLSFSDRNYIKTRKNNFDSVGRAIRNGYGLWVDHPLTERWRNNPETHDIRGGVDYSEDHPDQVSHNILIELINILNEEG